MLDSVVQEIDIPTGLVLFQWDSLDHVPLTDTYETLPTKAQPPTESATRSTTSIVNSIQPDTDGNLLISGRNTWAVYKVNQQTGAIMWTLGGKQLELQARPRARRSRSSTTCACARTATSS